MKKSFKMMGMAAMVLLLAVSCKKENKEEAVGETKAMTFTAGISQGNGKTYLNDHNLLWSEGDVININNQTFQLTEGKGTSKGVFEGEATEADVYYAVYPATGTLDGNTATITLPAVQPYVAGSFDKDIAPMVAMTDDSKSFTFTNVCGLLRLNVDIDGNDPVKRIELCGIGNELLAGKGTVEIMGENDVLTIPADAEGISRTVAVTSSTGISGDNCQIVFVLPAGALAQGFSAVFFADEAGNDELDHIQTTDDWTISAGEMNDVSISRKMKRQDSSTHNEKDASTQTTLDFTYSIQEAFVSATMKLFSDAELTYQVGEGATITPSGSKATPYQTGTVKFSNLSHNTVYYAQTYVKSVGEEVETAHGPAAVGTTLGDDDPVIQGGGDTPGGGGDEPGTGGETLRVAPEGALPYKFTINADDDYVFFAKGNLWCDASDIDNPVWHFEENQYDVNKTYEMKHVSHFYCNKGYVSAVGEAWNENDAAGNVGEIFADNISISDNVQQSGWRVPTTKSDGDWSYIFNKERMENVEFAYKKQTIEDLDGEEHDGLCIYPDNYNGDFTEASFSELEEEGIVFLPITGERSGSTMQNTDNGCYISHYAQYLSYMPAYFFCPLKFVMDLPDQEPSAPKYTVNMPDGGVARAIRLVHPGLEQTK